MLPNGVGFDTFYSCKADPVFVGYDLFWPVVSPYRYNVTFRKLGLSIVRPSVIRLAWLHAMFLCRIPKIVCVRSKKMMVRAATSRSVADMTKFHTLRYWANVKFPSDPMGKFKFLFIGVPQHSIAKRRCASSPQPAPSIRLYRDSFIKSFFKRDRGFSKTTVLFGIILDSHVSSFVGHVVRAAWERYLLCGPLLIIP